MTSNQQFRLPDVGEGLTEAEIVRWHVRVGDRIALNDVLVEIETAKSIVELPSPFEGVVCAIHAQEGGTVQVGESIVEISSAGSPASVSAEQAPATEMEGARPSVLVGYGPKPDTAPRRRRAHGRDAAPLPDSEVAPGQLHTRAVRRASPPVRKLARELGVDIGDLVGTGSEGRITRDDVRAWPEGRLGPTDAGPSVEPSSAAAPAVASHGETRTRIAGVRKATATAMVSSAFTAPHVTEWLSVDVTRTVKLVERLRASAPEGAPRISYLVLAARAVVSALLRFPEANAKWDERAGDIVQYRDVNLGIAVASPRGLLVPNIRAAQNLSTAALAAELGSLVNDARAGRTPVERMRGGTFTITNIGVFGVDGGTPIMNPGEAAILSLGMTRRLPWEHKGKVKLRSVATLAMSFDHRLIDGELGSRVLVEVARSLEDPVASWLSAENIGPSSR